MAVAEALPQVEFTETAFEIEVYAQKRHTGSIRHASISESSR